MATHVPSKFEHSYSVLTVLKKMRCMAFVCDFNIKIGEISIPTHRAVLAACSDYFVEMLSSGDEQICNGWITFDEMDVNAAQICIDFMYTGEAVVTMENVEVILQAANVMGLKGLIAICVQFLANSLAVSNCLQIKSLAGRFHLPATSNMAAKYALENYGLVVECSGFLGLRIEEVINFIQQLDGYDKKWNAALSWTREDVENRKADFTSMLEIVLSENCPFNFLFDVVRKENIMHKIQDCEKMAAEACFRKFHISHVALLNCYEILEFAKLSKDLCPQYILDEIRDFMAANFDEICSFREFNTLDYGDVTAILQCSFLQCSNDKIKWKAVTSWVKNSIRIRRNHFRKMLEILKLKKFGFTFHLETILQDPLVNRSQACITIVLSSLFAMMKITDINLSNWFYILELAKQYKGKSLYGGMEKLTEFAVMNFVEIYTSDEFVQLNESDVMRILESQHMNQYYDALLWEAMKKWVNGDRASRIEYLPQILEHSNIGNWSFELLYAVVQQDSLIEESTDSKTIVVNAFLTILTPEDITVENCFALLKEAKERADKSIIEDVHVFMVNNFEFVRVRENFCSLEKEDIMRLLQSPELKNWPEGIIWNSVMAWVKADIENRKDCVYDLLMMLELESYSFTFLFNYVYQEPLVKNYTDKIISVLFATLTYDDIDLTNWFVLLQKAKEYNQQLSDDKIVNMLKTFMENNFAKIDIQELEKNELICLLNSPKLCGFFQFKWQTILDWTKNKLVKRKGFFTELLASLNPTTFPFTILYEAKDESLVIEYPICTEMIINSLLSVTKLININQGNWAVLLKIARTHAGQRPTILIQYLREYMIAHFGEICFTEVFEDLDQEDIVHLLSSPKLAVSEEVKAKAGLKWVKADPNTRGPHLPTLFNLVKFETISKDFLKAIYEDSLVSSSDMCKDLIIRALFGNA